MLVAFRGPCLQASEHSWGLAEAEVSAPPEYVRRDILDHLRLAVPSCLAGHVLDLRLAFAEGFLRDAPLAPEIRDAQAQELELFWSRYCAFRLATASLSTEASGRCRFSQATFAGMHGNGRHAPIPAIRGTAIEPPESTHCGRST
jgi:hypothetical protein